MEELIVELRLFLELLDHEYLTSTVREKKAVITDILLRIQSSTGASSQTSSLSASRLLWPQVLSRFNRDRLLQPRGPLPTRLLSPWDFLGKDTGVGCHLLVQGVFPAQGSNPHLSCLLH